MYDALYEEHLAKELDARTDYELIGQYIMEEGRRPIEEWLKGFTLYIGEDRVKRIQRLLASQFDVGDCTEGTCGVDHS